MKKTPVRFDQKVVLQINLITEDSRTGAYHQSFYQIERILTALDLIATTLLLIVDFLAFVSDDLNKKYDTLTTAWNLGSFKVYLVILVIRLVVEEVSCGRIYYGHQSA